MIAIRPLTPDLMPGAVHLVMCLMREEGWEITERTRGATALSMMASQFAHVALVDERVVGLLDARLACEAATGERLEFFRFYVLPEFRRHGIGRRLIAAVLAAIPEQWGDLPVLIATAGPLRRSFRRLGFQTVSQVHATRLARMRQSMGRL